MVWLKRQQQVNAGHKALVGLMDALLQLQQGEHFDRHATGNMKLCFTQRAAGFEGCLCQKHHMHQCFNKDNAM